MKKPLSALDFCYQGEPENISVLECISLCVLVVAYDSGTRRARQMLTVMEVRFIPKRIWPHGKITALNRIFFQAIMPYFLRDLLRDKRTDTKVARETVNQLTLTMRALLNNCDELTK